MNARKIVLRDDQKEFLNALPSCDRDPMFWEKCGPCAQGKEKHIAFSECAGCEHLDINLLYAEMHPEGDEHLLDEDSVQEDGYFFDDLCDYHYSEL